MMMHNACFPFEALVVIKALIKAGADLSVAVDTISLFFESNNILIAYRLFPPK